MRKKRNGYHYRYPLIQYRRWSTALLSYLSGMLDGSPPPFPAAGLGISFYAPEDPRPAGRLPNPGIRVGPAPAPALPVRAAGWLPQPDADNHRRFQETLQRWLYQYLPAGAGAVRAYPGLCLRRGHPL